MSQWTIFSAADVVMDAPTREAVATLAANTFFADFNPRPLFSIELFPPAMVETTKFIVVDSIDNRWAQLICIGAVPGRGGVRLYVMAPFRTTNDARQVESFLTLVMPSAAEEHAEGAILAKMLAAGFSTYAMRYYHMVEAAQWREHYVQYRDSGNFAATVAKLANRPVCAYQFFYPGRRLEVAMAAARELCGAEIRNNQVHITEQPADAERERDLWIEENDEYDDNIDLRE